MTILEIPYSYAESGYRGRRQTTLHKRTRSANLLLRIPEVDASSAPVVARCSYPGYRLCMRDGTPDWMESNLEVDYRLYNGVLVRRALADSMFLSGDDTDYADEIEDTRMIARIAQLGPDCAIRGQDGAELAMYMLRLNCELGGAYNLCLAPLGGEPCRDEDIQLEVEEFARVADSSRSARAAQVRAGLQGGIVMVDDVLYVPSRGPAWVNKDEAGVLEAVPETAWVAVEDYVRTYMPHDPLVSTPQAFEHLDLSAHRTGRIEVLEPGPWMADPDEYIVRGYAGQSATPTLAGCLFRQGNIRGLHLLADIKAMMDSPQPCAGELERSLAQLASMLQRGMADSGYEQLFKSALSSARDAGLHRTAREALCNQQPAAGPGPG